MADNIKLRKRATIILKVGKHFEKGTINNRLNIDYVFNFTSLFGEIYSVGNVMRYLSYTNAIPSWISGPLRKEDHMIIKRNTTKRDVPNYWNILALIISDRIIADKQLIIDVLALYPGDSLEKLRIMPMHKVKSGLLNEEVFNARLKVFAIISGIHLRLIANSFRDEFGDDVIINDISDDRYNAYKHNIKSIIINKVFENLKSDNLFDGLDSTASNDLIITTFLNNK